MISILNILKSKKFTILFALFELTDYLSVGAGVKSLRNEMNQQYKRQYRELEDDVKEKISQYSKNKPKSEDHKQHISQAMTKYWQTVPHKPSGEAPSVTNGQIV